jgi:cell division septation protein DedD
MKLKRSILTPLILSAFAVMFLIILFNLSDNLNTLLDITRNSQENLEPGDRGVEDEAGTIGVKEIGGQLFRGKIPEMSVSKKTQNQMNQPEADLPDSGINLEKFVTDESQVSPDREPIIRDQEVSPSVFDRPKNYVFCVHYASYKHLTDAKTDVAGLSEKGFHARWVKADVPGKGEWFRVYVGMEKTRQDAMNLAVKLKEAGMIREIYVQKVKAE